MNREILEKSFPKKLIKTRKGAFGQALSYVEAIEYIRRLNDAFDGSWSFEIVHHQIIDKQEAVVLGKLSADGIVKQAFGGSRVTTIRESNEVISLADDLKSAATDSLKKCCSLLGIGLHLYSDEHQASQQAQSGSKPRKTQQRKSQRGNGGNGNGSKPDNGDERLSQKQLSYIWQLARRLGMDAAATRERAVELYGLVPEFLGKTDASTFITEMADQLGGNPVA